MKIEEIDKNLAVKTAIEKENICFYDCRSALFEINGLIIPEGDGKFLRLPQDIADKTNQGVADLNPHTAGGRLRFKTDSSYIAINAKTTSMSRMPHMPFTGSIGFDLYEIIDGQERYVASFIPPVDIEDGFETLYDFGSSKLRELVINFPLYGGVKQAFIGLEKTATVQKPHRYTHDVPIVYYGSSITQGGCASRPGMSYQAMISRRFNCDYINLGFSGSAKGEKIMAEYISKLKMSIFVYDYDHNAPNPEYLKATHKPMYDIIRKANPDLPIIMISKPNTNSPCTDARFEVIKESYDIAKRENDQNVYLIDGREFFAEIPHGGGTVDGCHPTDLGFYFMAEKIGDVIESIFNKTCV